MNELSQPSQDVAPSSKPEPVRGKWLRRILLIVAGLLIVAFLAIQLVPIQRTNPPVTTQIQWDSPQTEALARRACLDCHSNETTWPWYSYVAPSSWLIYYDVLRGRSEWNISTTGGTASRFGDSQGQQNDLAYRLGQVLAEGNRSNRPPNGEFPRNFNVRLPGSPPAANSHLGEEISRVILQTG